MVLTKTLIKKELIICEDSVKYCQKALNILKEYEDNMLVYQKDRVFENGKIIESLKFLLNNLK